MIQSLAAKAAMSAGKKLAVKTAAKGVAKAGCNAAKQKINKKKVNPVKAILIGIAEAGAFLGYELIKAKID